jgi:Heat shock protein
MARVRQADDARVEEGVGMSSRNIVWARAALLSALAALTPRPAPAVDLEDTHWALVGLRGEPVAIPAGRGSPYLVLQSKDARVVGSGGCNHLSGGYTREGDRLSFSRIARTLMACADGMDLEREFLEALEEVTHWRIEGDRLRLFDSEGALVAELKAV